MVVGGNGGIGLALVRAQLLSLDQEAAAGDQ